MSLSDAKSYAARAKKADDLREATKYFEQAIQELCKVVKHLKERVADLEAQVH